MADLDRSKNSSKQRMLDASFGAPSLVTSPDDIGGSAAVPPPLHAALPSHVATECASTQFSRPLLRYDHSVPILLNIVHKVHPESRYVDI